MGALGETNLVGIGVVIRLSSLELEILTWVSYGKRYGDISQIKGMSENAVHQHVHNIMKKLNANSAAGAVGIALRKGIIK